MTHVLAGLINTDNSRDVEVLKRAAFEYRESDDR